MFKVRFQDLGTISYKEAWDLQQKQFDAISAFKLKQRNAPGTPLSKPKNTLYFCDHPHVYTLGKHGEAANLLLNQSDLESKNIEFYKINRGGDITYHGPGQIVGYPIFDLEDLFTDIGKFLRLMEQAIINTLETYTIQAGRIEGLTGVWVDHTSPKTARKICAMGLHISRWVTMHGLALNVNSNVDYFNYIIPCGIRDKGVTSMQNELGIDLPIDKVKKELKNQLQNVYDIQWL
jgi:lipoyl(octanoyl) transferase